MRRFRDNPFRQSMTTYQQKINFGETRILLTNAEARQSDAEKLPNQGIIGECARILG